MASLHDSTARTIDGAGEVKGSFTSFLVGRDGRLLARSDPRTEPEAPALVAALEQALG